MIHSYRKNRDKALQSLETRSNIARVGPVSSEEILSSSELRTRLLV